MKRYSTILTLVLACLGGCVRPNPQSDDITTVQKWVQCMSNERTGISEAMDLMGFPFNSDGKLLTQEETRVKLTEWRQILLSPGCKVTWSGYQRLSEAAPDHPLRHSLHLKERASRSPQSIASMVLVLCHVVLESPPGENTDGNVFFIDSAGKIVGMSN